MSTRQRRDSFLYKLFVPAFCLVLSAYFLHHALSGDYGLNAQVRLEEDSIHLGYKLAALREKREKLEKRVMLLKNGSIERDMLDEQARYQLNLLNDDEIAILRVNQ